MIFQAINFIQRKLNDRVGTVAANIGEIVAETATIPGDGSAGIVLSLVNVEENRISRDPRNYQRAGTSLILKNPAVHLNLTLLFTAIRRNEAAYENALINLQAVVEVCSSINMCSIIPIPQGLDPGIEKLILEMMTVNMEQLNHLWSIMGGRYQPSVVYKMRMVTIDSVTGEVAMLSGK